jgi:hypothetical protein
MSVVEIQPADGFRIEDVFSLGSVLIQVRNCVSLGADDRLFAKQIAPVHLAKVPGEQEACLQGWEDQETGAGLWPPRRVSRRMHPFASVSSYR